MAADNAINVESWTQLLANAQDSQEITWQKAIVLGTRGRSNPFHDLIGGIDGMKPIMEVMDWRATQGQQIVITLDRPLGGAGTQGPASLTRLTGREEQTQQATYRATVGLMAHAVSGEQLMESETVIGLDWDTRNRKKLTEWFAWKQADDIQFEMITRAGPYTTLYPNNKTSIDQLNTNDSINLDTVVLTQELLNTNQALPFDITRSNTDEEILAYLLMGPSKAWHGLQGSTQYQNLLAQADARGPDNKLFRGGLPDWMGTRLYKWNVEDGTQVGPLGSPCSPIAYTGVAIPATTTTSVYNIVAGGMNAKAAANLDALFFQYYENSAYLAHEGYKRTADTSTTRFLAIKIVTGADTGKIAIFSYQVNNGNQITVLNRLGASISGIINTTVGSMVYNTGAWTIAAGPNGFQGLSTGIIPIGSPVYQVNAQGVPYLRSFGLGRSAVMCGWGNLSQNRAYGSGGGTSGQPGQRLLNVQDSGRLFALGWQQVWGSRACENANNLTNGFVLVVSSYQPTGWPDIVF